MTNPKVSVVLSCYHVEQYLPKVHADLLAQSFQDYELIYVNDGGVKPFLTCCYPSQPRMIES